MNSLDMFFSMYTIFLQFKCACISSTKRQAQDRGVFTQCYRSAKIGPDSCLFDFCCVVVLGP